MGVNRSSREPPITTTELFERGMEVRREVLLQTAVYCGVPAAIDSFRVARELFKEMDAGG